MATMWSQYEKGGRAILLVDLAEIRMGGFPWNEESIQGSADVLGPLTIVVLVSYIILLAFLAGLYFKYFHPEQRMKYTRRLYSWMGISLLCKVLENILMVAFAWTYIDQAKQIWPLVYIRIGICVITQYAIARMVLRIAEGRDIFNAQKLPEGDWQFKNVVTSMFMSISVLFVNVLNSAFFSFALSVIVYSFYFFMVFSSSQVVLTYILEYTELLNRVAKLSVGGSLMKPRTLFFRWCSAVVLTWLALRALFILLFNFLFLDELAVFWALMEFDDLVFLALIVGFFRPQRFSYLISPLPVVSDRNHSQYISMDPINLPAGGGSTTDVAVPGRQESRPVQPQTVPETDLPIATGVEPHLESQSSRELRSESQGQLNLVRNADSEIQDLETGVNSANLNQTNAFTDATIPTRASVPEVVIAAQRFDSGHLHTILTFAEMNARDPLPWRYGMLLPFPVDREAWTLIWRNYYIVSISDSAATSALLNQTQRSNEKEVYVNRLPGSIILLTGERTLSSTTYPFHYSATLRHVYIALPVKAKPAESGGRSVGIVL